jgi:hypothetical protein
MTVFPRRVPPHARVLVALALVASILGPYWRLATMRAVLVTDDGFVSDSFGGELPARAWAGLTVRSGEAPIWARDISGGYPMTIFEPSTLALFAALPPLWAANLQLLGLLLTASFGAYALSRALGADRVGAGLAALAFSYSGFVVCQLKHVSAMQVATTVPWALLALERAVGPRTGGLRFVVE